MLCDECGKNEATVHVQAFTPDGESKTLKLCQECMQKHKLGMNASQEDFAQLLGNLFGKFAERIRLESDKYDAVCPSCAMTYREFRTGRMLGCEHCYDAFRERIEEMLLARGRGAKYVRDGREREMPSAGSELRRLKREMETAIADEDYELAAVLRDEIRALKTEQQ